MNEHHRYKWECGQVKFVTSMFHQYIQWLQWIISKSILWSFSQYLFGDEVCDINVPPIYQVAAMGDNKC